MAAEYAKAISIIVKLATSKKKDDLNKSRDRLDEALYAIKKAGDKGKDAFLKDLKEKLKDNKKGLSQVLKGESVGEHDLIYDAFGESMEPIYYWMLDFMKDMQGYKIDKVADFFAASEASGYYGEMGQRRTAMESRIAGGGGGAGLFGTINLIVKSIINLLFDLKTFDLRLKNYDDLKVKDPLVKKSACEALKGI